MPSYSGTSPQRYFNSATARPSSEDNKEAPMTKEQQAQRLRQLLEMLKQLPKEKATNEDGDKIIDIEEKIEEEEAPKAPQVATPNKVLIDDEDLETKRSEMVKWWADVMEKAPLYGEPDHDEEEVKKAFVRSKPTVGDNEELPRRTKAFTGVVTEHGEGNVKSEEVQPKRMSKFKMDKAAKKGFGGMFAARHGIPVRSSDEGIPNKP
ncbi:branched-chain-amino-acid aminotransferase [Perkinsus chesapeaki]|uniref:Branched-chain-amino-acid aminotransferase n=1 Tax=Perkinsus chesapeaki TaxID=330153 RepID=A0A7J6MRW2_PERCH|nr:branched-chain-amino-acid aminotransferase [Perkinsus chesapeaki]